MLALAAVVTLVAVGLVAVSNFDPASMFADDAEAALDATPAEQRSPLARSSSQRRVAIKATPVVRVLNTGTVDSDPVRHDAVVQELARAAATPSDAATADDDLDPGGTAADWYPAQVKTYRTVCVRLCDGALSPISFSTTRDRFALDALRCRKSCGSPSRLYIQKNPASDADGLVDLDGRGYSTLDTAFKFRTSYDSACTCRAHAWESLAQARHRVFEIQDRLRGGQRITQGRMVRLKLAAAKSARYAARLPRPDTAVVTGSADRTIFAADPPAAIEARAESEAGEDVAVKTAVEKAALKVGKTRRGKAYAQAKSKTAQGKWTGDQPLLVLFEPPSAKAAFPASKLVTSARGSNNLRQADVSTRRYDGSDWRISNYEPL